MKSIGVVTTVLVVLAAYVLGGILWSGFVLSVLWGWFIVPVFHIPSLSIALAIGLTLVVRMLTSTSTESDDEEYGTDRLIRAVSFAFGWPLVALIMGYFVHLFI